jgi:HAE1 family hydrophobic/amphiphilic exporter-1
MQWVRDRMAGIDGVLVTVAEINAIGGEGGMRSQPIQFSIRGNKLEELTTAAEAMRADWPAARSASWRR